MYCPNCGNQINDNSVTCMYCGAQTGNRQNYNNYNPEHQTSKTIIGVLLSLVLGLIGLVIGILLYPSGTVARSTFIKGWLIAFVISTVLGIILSIVYIGAIFALIG